MPKLLTQVDIPEPPFRISYKEKGVWLGSCFADEVGQRVRDHFIPSLVNPFGVLFNPVSIRQAVQQVVRPEKEPMITERDGLYHSWMHHGQFSSVSHEELIAKINNTNQEFSLFLSQADYVCVTLGTARVFRLKETGEVVANCHKFPANLFERELLSVEQVCQELVELEELLKSVRPGIKMVVTVSPVRHWKDGAHANQLSKATLLLAIDQFQKEREHVYYFPAYELVMDELRDYRFYGPDLVHVNEQGVGYVWEKLTEVLFDVQARRYLKTAEKMQALLNHRLLHPESISSQQFLESKKQKRDAFLKEYPEAELPVDE